MRLEVLIGSEEPKTYSLNKTRLIIGTSEFSDIRINESGVSRKHAVIMYEDEKYFVVDQGSTNGTFINEERIVPGRKVEFTSFFPLRLGANVLVTLLTDGDEIPVPREVSVPLELKVPPGNSETRQISLKDLSNKAKSQKLIQESQNKRNAQKAPAKNPAPPPKKKSFSLVPVLATLIFGGAAYYNFFVYQPPPEEKIAKVGEVVEVVKEPTPAPTAPEKDIPAPTVFETLAVLKNDLKCTTDVEKYLCETIPKARESQWGVVQSGSKLNVLIDGTEAFEAAKKVLPETASEADLKLFTIAAFIHGLPELESPLLTGLSLNFGFFTKAQETETPTLSFATTPELLKELKPQITDEILGEIPKSGTAPLEIVKSYIKIL